MSRLESSIQRDIEIELGAEPDLLLLRNSVGKARFINESTGKEYTVPYGLLPGSPDLVGILRKEILTTEDPTEPLRAITVGLWFCLEVKQPGEKATAEQANVHRIWKSFGAFVETVTSVAEAKAALARARQA